MRNRNNERLRKAVESAIESLFSDTTVSQDSCIANLRDVIADCELKIAAIEADQRRRIREGGEPKE